MMDPPLQFAVAGSLVPPTTAQAEERGPASNSGTTRQQQSSPPAGDRMSNRPAGTSQAEPENRPNESVWSV